MKIIVLGDTHGRSNWKEVVNTQTFDKLIFIGDYFDTHDNISVGQQMENFLDIIEYKKSSNKEIVLLFGNHDYHYLSGVDENYSGYNEWAAHQICIILDEYKSLLQMCHVQNDFVFTHAGVTKTWCKNHEIDLENLEQSINDLFQFKPLSFSFRSNVGGRYDMCGNDITQSPIWVRPHSLMQDAIEGYNQVVGHTSHNRMTVINDRFYFIDTLGTSGEVLIIENGIAKASRIELQGSTSE